MAYSLLTWVVSATTCGGGQTAATIQKELEGGAVMICSIYARKPTEQVGVNEEEE